MLDRLKEIKTSLAEEGKDAELEDYVAIDMTGADGKHGGSGGGSGEPGNAPGSTSAFLTNVKKAQELLDKMEVNCTFLQQEYAQQLKSTSSSKVTSSLCFFFFVCVTRC